VTADGLAPDQALRLAAAVEADSEHAIAQGIVRATRTAASMFREQRPLRRSSDGREGAGWTAGSSTWAAQRCWPCARSSSASVAGGGGSRCAPWPSGYLPANEGRCSPCLQWRTSFALNRRKPSRALQERKIEVVIDDGDARPVRRPSPPSSESTPFLPSPPEQKASKIEELKSRGKARGDGG